MNVAAPASGNIADTGWPRTGMMDAKHPMPMNERYDVIDTRGGKPLLKKSPTRAVDDLSEQTDAPRLREAIGAVKRARVSGLGDNLLRGELNSFEQYWKSLLEIIVGQHH